ncbi:hypothetical protein SAMN05444280_1649 [Tangfeifania diversioriginum]|uniref:Uncharacterized protein n=1 Tax=Tangfeifania diversioriginum TaxID=1168035 RepID=A0A1M6PM53_9BACT|nr:hypothetical protein SAMN05444280_1649 [Tangfeifania diversioriginum]
MAEALIFFIAPGLRLGLNKLKSEKLALAVNHNSFKNR